MFGLQFSTGLSSIPFSFYSWFNPLANLLIVLYPYPMELPISIITLGVADLWRSIFFFVLVLACYPIIIMVKELHFSN